MHFWTPEIQKFLHPHVSGNPFNFVAPLFLRGISVLEYGLKSCQRASVQECTTSKEAEIRLLDFHRIVVAILKSTFPKQQLTVVI